MHFGKFIIVFVEIERNPDVLDSYFIAEESSKTCVSNIKQISSKLSKTEVGGEELGELNQLHYSSCS
jgi:hypothetical protein